MAIDTHVHRWSASCVRPRINDAREGFWVWDDICWGCGEDRPHVCTMQPTGIVNKYGERHQCVSVDGGTFCGVTRTLPPEDSDHNGN